MDGSDPKNLRLHLLVPLFYWAHFDENNPKIILHRSPPIEGTEKLDLFVIDPIFDLENEI